MRATTVVLCLPLSSNVARYNLTDEYHRALVSSNEHQRWWPSVVTMAI